MIMGGTLTLGPGGPTLPAAPGKPVAPCQREKQSSKHKHTQPGYIHPSTINN